MSTITPAASSPVLLTVRQAAERLGITYDQIRVAIHAGTLPAMKVRPGGKSWYINRDDLVAFARGISGGTSHPPHSP